MTKNIYLTGFMGCGKSTIGLSLSKLTGRKFLDLDKYIENAVQKNILEIFSENGEEHFRTIETEYLTEISSKKNLIVSLGGGTILKEENVEICRNNGIIVYLELDFESSYERIKESDRPLVKNNSKEQLRKIFQERQEIYSKSSYITINADNSPFMITKEIKKLVNK